MSDLNRLLVLNAAFGNPLIYLELLPTDSARVAVVIGVG